MLVKVQSKSKFGEQRWGQTAYTYRCEYDARVGDIVKVPAGDNISIARICEIDVPEYSVSSALFPKLKTVIGPAEYEETLFDSEPAAEESALAVPGTDLSDNIIVIKQLPIIEDQLRELRATVEEKVNEALSLAVTEDTVKAVKAVKAALNKEYKALEEKRKQVKLAILEPYDRFEATYRECIGNLYTDADQKLKEKIDAVDNAVKKQKRDALKIYYEEYRTSLHLDGEQLADFDSWCTKVNKSASDNSLRDAAKAFLDGLRSDLNTINTMESADEILVEYQSCRSLSSAIATVNERHRLAEESRRRRADMEAERVAREAREREAAARVEAAAAANRPETMAPPMEAPEPPQPAPAKDPNQVFLKRSFTLFNVKRYQLAFIKNYLIQEGIEYK